MPDFYEFFAGGGMARAGLGERWNCLFANDFDSAKSRAYRANWGDRELRTADVSSIAPEDIPGRADLVWASFPCQDLSLAGNGAGLQGDRSGTYGPFWFLVEQLVRQGRSPKTIVLENVCGAITSHGGKDFATICSGFERLGYFVGALVVNASLFVPQSRPRLFFVGVRRDMELPEPIFNSLPSVEWHPKALKAAYEGLSTPTKLSWVWWNLPLPQRRCGSLIDILEDSPADVQWFSEHETVRLLSLMNPLNLAKVRSAMKVGHKVAGCIYKRTRPTESGIRIQRAEVRFDEIAGCLRTPTGGSSRQVILIVEGQSVRARLISARETARLMGLSESYKLPDSYNEAYHLTGDGVAVPVVRHLAEHILEPLIEHRLEDETVAA